MKIKKVLILGSGALQIGQAGEFDYSGSQAIKALKEEGIKTILINPNIATIQTSKELADTVYFLPVTPRFVEKVIKKEKPDGILLSFGGQTALNCGLALEKSGTLSKYKVSVLGSPVSAIRLSEDRDAFAKHLATLSIPTAKSEAVTNTKEALSVAKKLGYPVMVRAGFALGGQGSGIVHNEGELKELSEKAFTFVEQILIEQYLHHFKEVEYEVVRDKYDNCITVCNMENMDPMGIHTGESVVVAPSQTLTNLEFQTLRDASIKIVRSLGIIGECNVQFALNPNPKTNTVDYYVIELNARLSRSSALASKATGYPLAYVAAKLALGIGLTEIKNKVTLVTQSCFEPALDYIVVKIPRWDIEKFKGADETIGSSMKSVGEVMGIGRTFEEAYQKAIRMLDLDLEGVFGKLLMEKGNHLQEKLSKPTPKRMFAIAHALQKGISVEEIHSLTGIDPWFINRIKTIVDAEKNIKSVKDLTEEVLWELKQLGSSDKHIGELVGKTGLEIRDLRKKLKVLPSIFQIDTLAAEFAAKTNYLYITYNGHHNDVEPLHKDGVMVLGSGPYRIGSSVEFDWSTVTTALSLKKYDKKSIMVNCNPETVSTDYDISDRLYFEELTFERIADIYDFENPHGVIISVGGQTPNNRSQSLKQYGCTILGTDPEYIDLAEDRRKFSKLCDELGIAQPAWDSFTSLESAVAFSKKVEFPVLLRPSFVLSGTMMRICHTEEELSQYIKEAAHVSEEYPVTISKFIENVKELELDAIAQNGDIKSFMLSEHVENAGVHSGDATIVLPAQKTYIETARRARLIAIKLAKALHITGPFNIQFLAKDNDVSVIEINLRASRTFPFIAKVTGNNFIEMFVDSLFKKRIKDSYPRLNSFVACKVAQFSFARLTGADPILSVEMASTGEVACFGEDLEEAFLKGLLSVGFKLPEKGIFLTLGGELNKLNFLPLVKKLTTLNLPIYATTGTNTFLAENGIKTIHLYKLQEKKLPNVLEAFHEGKVDLAINIVENESNQDLADNFHMRRGAIDHNIPVVTNFKKAELLVNALTGKKLDDLQIKSWDEYRT